MQTECVYLNRVPTKVLTWGRTLEDSNSVHIGNENLNYIICIPGNPGVTEFYIEFLEEIYKKTNNTVWIIGHSGHDVVDSYKKPSPEENKDLYSLQGQVKHKISFLENHVPKNAKITLIGHSIGCYMILKLLQVPSIQSRIVKSYLLFPTIEYMAETRNGTYLMRFIKYCTFLLFPLITLFNLCPLVIQNSLLYIHCKLTSMPHDCMDIVRNFINVYNIHNVITMAYDEMLQVKERDNETIKRNLNLIKFYYGASDGWVPLRYYVNIKKDIPEIDAEVCDKGFEHAFILRSSKPMADKMVSWMKES